MAHKQHPLPPSRLGGAMESCRHLHSFVSKVMGFVFRSDRPGNLRYLQQHGPEAFVAFKRQQGKQ